MSDCRFGVLPVNYPDPDPELLFTYMFCLLSFFLRHFLIKHGILFTKFARVEFECMFSFVSLLFISLLELFL